MKGEYVVIAIAFVLGILSALWSASLVTMADAFMGSFLIYGVLGLAILWFWRMAAAAMNKNR
jgi:hypothetical protein